MVSAKYPHPDYFSLSPLVAILPVIGRVSGLAPLTSSLFARYEKVKGLQDEMSSEPDKAAFRRLAAEAQMLKQVLDWLSVNPTK